MSQVKIVNNYTFPKRKKEEQPKEEPIMSDIPNETITPVVVTESPSGHFPTLTTNLQDELNTYLGRSKEAANQIILLTREKAEFLETLAERAKQELEKEKHNLNKLMG
jgi:hypothetical protein